MLLYGKELAAGLKTGQIEAVQKLHAKKVFPTLAIVMAGEDAASAKFVELKQLYGQEIGVNVVLHKAEADSMERIVEQLNKAEHVHGLIVQLPLPADFDTDRILKVIKPSKDVDALGEESAFESPTANAITSLLEQSGVDLTGKQIAVVGHGRLVGRPVVKKLRSMGHVPRVYDEDTTDLTQKVYKADVVITATGRPNSIVDKMIHNGTVVIDAGTAKVGENLVGDADPGLYERKTISITPVPGGVGPLTVANLFANLITAASAK